jgi:uncharacterized protein
MKLAHDIEVKLRDVDEICERFSVKELSLFGSALGASFDNRSDLDFLVEFQPGTPVGLFHLIRMQHELEDLFERRVDLVPKGDLKKSIREEILNQAQILYAR